MTDSRTNTKPPGPPPPIPFTPRLALGLLGVLLAAMATGLNGRVPGLLLADVRGHLGISYDQSTWLDSMFTAGELIAMPFSCWFAVTFSFRRFHLSMLAGMLGMATIMPFIHDFHWLAGLRLIQGIFSGALIPLLMMGALRFMPINVRLHGLALYAMTATLAPNISLWLAAVLIDDPVSVVWLYWQIIPLGLIAGALVFYGIPKLPLALPRIKQANWFGMAFGIPGMALLATGIAHGVRLEWWHSPLERTLLSVGGLLTLTFLFTEWFHPSPFMRLQLLSRRNLGLGFIVFFLLLIGMTSGVSLPTSILEHTQGFRVEQLTWLGLSVGLPQILLGSVVAILLYQKWIDARYLFAVGLSILAGACYLGSQVTSEWMVAEFFWAQTLQAIGQPIAVVCLLFLATSVVQPMEGPFVAGIINALRVIGTLISGAVTGQISLERSTFHSDMLINQAGQWLTHNSNSMLPSELSTTIASQASVLASADTYRIFMFLLIALIPAVLCLNYIAPPTTTLPQQARGS